MAFTEKIEREAGVSAISTEIHFFLQKLQNPVEFSVMMPDDDETRVFAEKA